MLACDRVKQAIMRYRSHSISGRPALTSPGGQPRSIVHAPIYLARQDSSMEENPYQSPSLAEEPPVMAAKPTTSTLPTFDLTVAVLSVLGVIALLAITLSVL